MYVPLDSLNCYIVMHVTFISRTSPDIHDYPSALDPSGLSATDSITVDRVILREASVTCSDHWGGILSHKSILKSFKHPLTIIDFMFVYSGLVMA
jgi:hypothetical protein